MKTYDEMCEHVADTIRDREYAGSSQPWLGLDIATLAWCYECTPERLVVDITAQVEGIDAVARKRQLALNAEAAEAAAQEKARKLAEARQAAAPAAKTATKA